MITIRRATLDDKPELFKFIQKAYDGRWQYKIPDRWEWLFVNNPHLGKGDLPVFIAVEDSGQIVGQSCAMIEQVKIGSEYHPLGWSVDTFVLSEYRSQGIGHKLQKVNDESHELFTSLWLLSTTNRKIKMELGSVDLDPVPVYRRYLKFTPDIFRNALGERGVQNKRSLRRWLSARLRLSFLSRFLTLMKDNLPGLRSQSSITNLDQNLTLTEVETFPEEVDLLWRKLSIKFYAIVKRDRLHLNWKYVKQPNMNYLRIIAYRGGEICGYLVLRKCKPPERNIGKISDLFVDPSDDRAISILLMFAVNYFRQQQVTEIVTATSIPEYQHYMSKFGFVKTSEVYPVIHSRVNTPAIEMALEPSKWFLGKSDHDWDQYPYAD